MYNRKAEQLTMSKTRFGSRSKCPINDCKILICYNKYRIKKAKSIALKQLHPKTLIIPTVAADPF